MDPNPQELLSGFVAIAPTTAEDYPDSFYKGIDIPTLILYGDKYEKMERKKTNKLLHIPKSQALSIPKSGLAVYLDNPSEWEKVLYNFLLNLLPDGKKNLPENSPE